MGEQCFEHHDTFQPQSALEQEIVVVKEGEITGGGVGRGLWLAAYPFNRMFGRVRRVACWWCTICGCEVENMVAVRA